MGRGRQPRYGPLAVENFFASAPKRHPAEATDTQEPLLSASSSRRASSSVMSAGHP